MIISTKYTRAQLDREIKKVILARARGKEVSADKMEELLLDASMFLKEGNA